MKRTLLIISLYIITQSFIKAQDTAFIYLDANWWETTKENAFNHRKAYKTDKNTWIVTGYYDNGHIQMICEYNDKKFTQKNGKFEYYYENGHIKTRGEYLENKKNGNWKNYYENGNIKSEVMYSENKKNGRGVEYFENSNIEEEGEYSNGNKKGYWTYYFEDGKKCSKAKFEDNGVRENIYWDDNGKEINQKVAEFMPSYPGGEEKLLEYIKYNTIYPRTAKNSGINGTVLLSFVVNEIGEITDIKIINSVGGGCDEEAIRVVQNMPKWNPGKLCNRPVSVYFNLPIKFTLK
jgi:TonB family protein